MLQENIVRGDENATEVVLRKKTGSQQVKGLKQRSKALSDVKNTIHSHSSNLNEKKSDKKANKGLALGKPKTGTETSKRYSVLETENEIPGANMPHAKFHCHNHSMCEKANNPNQEEFLNEYRLTEKEIGYFSDRMKFFSLDTFPLKLNTISAMEDLEVNYTKRPSLSDDEDVENIFEIPEPF